MKKLTKITALALALALLLGMTTFAQSTLLLVEKFDYAGADAYLNSLVVTSGVTKADRTNGSVFDVEALRAAGTLKGRSGTYNDTAANGSMGTNFRGNKQFLSGNDGSNTHAYMYLLPSSWDAKGNADKSLIVSFETSPFQAYCSQHSINQGWFSMIGYNGTEYKGAVAMGTYYNNGQSFCYNYDGIGYNTMNLIPDGTTETQAIEYKWDTESNQLIKAMTGVDGTKRWNKGYGYSDNLKGYTTVDGVSIFFAKGYPSVANLKIYTIDNTEGFKVSSTIGGKEDVLASTDKITLKFTQPVAFAKFSSELITITANDEEVSADDYVVGALRTIDATVGGETYSEVDITFPNGLAYETAYNVIVDDGLANEIGTVIGEENNVVAFTTEATPTCDIELKAYAGLTAKEGEELPALSKGTTYFVVTAAKSVGNMANGNVRIEILDNEGNVVKFASFKRSFSTIATFGAAFKLEAGQTAKAYVIGTNGEATID